ncbi:N-substituted formamide deformylase precursor [Roseovarius albus]|uniref:N-substituted formamide deformylase n=1 Tax=Roseovarius albus TaxID=1247867 RepID=A0A1X6ZZ62_9RHOB|nr:amidohydrolase [Roseovarius albus]SLN65962.1 N-substituted formamide deformylase precursor [Roseovarius albus]
MAEAAVLYFNGDILTMDDARPEVEAVLTRGERIEAIGDLADLRAGLSGVVEEVDLQGQCMIPAFIDPHGHFPDPGFIKLFRVDLSAPPRGDCTDMATALERLSEKAQNTPKGDWVMGVLFDNTAVAERRMPTRDELDSVSLEHPVWVIHASGHNGTANSYILDMLGLTRDTPDPVGGRFGRDPDTGELTGLIEGISAMGELGDTDFLIDRRRFWEGFNACRDEYLEHGVTFAQNAWASRQMLDHFASLPEGEDPGMDLVVLPQGELEPELTQGPDVIEWSRTPYITLGPRKLFTDGAFQLQTAYLSEPYHRPSDPDAPCGMPYCDPDEFKAKVKQLHSMGFQIHCHCNGDRGADLLLDAIEAALAEHSREDHRHTVIHGQVLRDDQLERMARIGVTVSFFSAHIHFWGDRHYDTFLGPERAAKISPAASAERYGVRYTLHNDASVTPTRPLHLTHCAVNRKTASGRTLGEGEKISVLEAFKAQTVIAAWQVFKEDERGTIKPGKLADFTVLTQNPVRDANLLARTSVVQTIRRGRCAYRDGQLAPKEAVPPKTVVTASP